MKFTDKQRIDWLSKDDNGGAITPAMFTDSGWGAKESRGELAVKHCRTLRQAIDAAMIAQKKKAKP